MTGVLIVHGCHACVEVAYLRQYITVFWASHLMISNGRVKKAYQENNVGGV